MPAEEAELCRAYREIAATLARLCNTARLGVERAPQSREARLLWAQMLLGAGRRREALAEIERLLRDAPPNERPMLEQTAQQCRADHIYFPPWFVEFLKSSVYGAGCNAEAWRDYAGRDIERAREIVSILRQRVPLRGRRALDVGSGYGAMLIALAEAGADAVGVEIDRGRFELGQRRLADIGIRCESHLGSISDPAMPARLGMFDIIVCQDVLEHVDDPGAAIRALSGLLHPGGLIFVQVPNKYSAEYILADHHYALPGISLLARPQAIAYWQAAYGQAAEQYTVGYLRTEKYYRSAFRHAGVDLALLDSFPSPEHVHWYAEHFSRLAEKLGAPLHPALATAQNRKVRARAIRVLQLYVHACRCLKELEQDPAQLAQACHMIVSRLCLGVWRFLGEKTGGRASASATQQVPL